MYCDNEKALVLSAMIDQKKADLKPNAQLTFPKRLFSLLSMFLVLFLLFSFSVIPHEFCHAIGSPTFWDSRVYPMGLVDEGSENAGLKGRATEYLFQSTSEWTTEIADLEDGNFMMQAPLLSLPGVPFPVGVTLTYNHYNAGIDIGLGKGWMTDPEVMNLIEGIKAAITIKFQNIIFIEIMKKAIEKIINQYSAMTITDKVEFKLTGHSSGYIYSGSGNTSYCDCSPNLDNCNDWDNSTQANFKDEFKNYHDSLINDINNLSSKSDICNMLNSEWMNHKATYDNYLWWFGSDYPQDYTKVHPFDDKKWHDEFHYQWEYDLRLYHNARYEAGTLQIIDCLRKKYGCGAIAVMPDPE